MPTCQPTPTRRRTTRLVPLLAALLLAAVACGSGGGADRDTAIANLTAGQDPLTEGQANCVVDGVGEDNLGDFDNFSRAFQDEVEGSLDAPSPEVEQLFDVLFDCALSDLDIEGEVADALGDLDVDLGDLDVDSLEDLESGLASELAGTGADGLASLTDGEIDCAAVEGPCEYGDDATLDGLWEECEGGSGEACDQLFFDSPIGSRYEQFGNTCGDRGAELTCAEVYN